MMDKASFIQARSMRTPRSAPWVAVWVCFMVTLMTGDSCGGGSTAPQTASANSAALVSITVSPATVSVRIGSSQQFTANGNYADGTTKDLTNSVSWVSSTPGVATVSASGLATAVASGKTSIGASVGSINASARLTVMATDPLGTASASSISCPTGLLSGTCYKVAISCPNINDFTGYVKVTYPSGTPAGTILFATGENGTSLYEQYGAGASAMLNTILQAGFTLAQISWGAPFTTSQPYGWQTGPGGIRAVACRVATVAQWIYTNIHLANTTAPYCATGNSGGAELLGLAMAHYGAGSIFSLIEATSGPPFTRQDWACDWQQPAVTNPCGNPGQGFGLTQSAAENYVDPAYTPPVSCLYEVNHRSTIYDSIFLNDSVTSPGAALNYPNTFVRFLYGQLDAGTAPNQGHVWASAITSSKSEACVPNTGHGVPNTPEGTQQIASDLLTYCKLPAGGQQ